MSGFSRGFGMFWGCLAASALRHHIRQLLEDAMSTIRRTGILTVCVVAVATGCGKADISTNCTMNGNGDGSCQFTNTGKRSGSVCGVIVVKRTELADRYDSATEAKLTRLAVASTRESDETGVPRRETKSWKEWENQMNKVRADRNSARANLPRAESAMFCSGAVGGRETKSVDFTVPEVREICDSSSAGDKSWSDVCSFTFAADVATSP